MQVVNVLTRSEMSAGAIAVGGYTKGASFASKLTVSKPKTKKRWLFFSAAGFIAAAVLFFVISSPTISVPVIAKLFTEQLKEATDKQHADEVESMIIIFQKALEKGSVPPETARLLKENDVMVGYIEDGAFVEGNSHQDGLVLKMGNKIVKSENFVSEIHDDIYLYKAFDAATYSGVANYYSDTATKIINKYSSRNNFTNYSDTKSAEENYSVFTETMDKIVGGGSGSISVNGVSAIQDEDSEEKTYTESGKAADSKTGTGNFINTLAGVITGESEQSATINCASVADVVDTLSLNDFSIRFSLGIMETFSKVLIGEMGDSYAYEALSYLFEESTSQIVDEETQELVTITGSASNSPSMYAVLTGSSELSSKEKKIAGSFGSGRVLRLIKNAIGVGSAHDSITTNVASASTGSKAAVGRLNTGAETCDVNALSKIEPIISSSQENTIEKVKGIPAGEILVNGLEKLQNELARANGGVAGDEEAVMKYNTLTKKILAMDAEIDRMNRSPFDITSKNTFLGSIIYNVAIAWGRSGTSAFAKSMTLVSTTSDSVANIFPTTNADSDTGFSSIFGTCETLDTAGVVGSIHCAESITFDVSTLDNPLDNPNMIALVKENTTLDSSGNYVVNDDSVLADFLRNTIKGTPLGIIDGGILDSLKSKASSIPFISNIVSIVKNFLDASPIDRLIASGAAFVNSKSNQLWDTTYRWAQRYISLLNARDIMRWAAGDGNAYNNIPLLEGNENPIVAYLNKQSQLAEK